MKRKFYVVWQGRKPGIYDSYEKANAQVSKYPGAKWQGFATRSEAEQAYRNPPEIESKKNRHRKHTVVAYEDPPATKKQLDFIEALRIQLGEMVFEHTVKSLKLSELDDWSKYEASEIIDAMLEIKDTPKMRPQIEGEVAIAEVSGEGTSITEMQIILDRLVTELRIHNPKRW